MVYFICQLIALLFILSRTIPMINGDYGPNVEPLFSPFGGLLFTGMGVYLLYRAWQTIED